MKIKTSFCAFSIFLMLINGIFSTYNIQNEMHLADVDAKIDEELDKDDDIKDNYAYR